MPVVCVCVCARACLQYVCIGIPVGCIPVCACLWCVCVYMCGVCV